MQTPPLGRVLVVDDDPTVAEVVAGYLDRAGYDVDRAADGPAALDRADAHGPDLVVLDLMLPGMDGLEVCRRLRARGPVPVIMLTARGDEDERILGLEVGADDYVTKPFSPRELVLRVESVLRRARAATAPKPTGPLRAAALTVDPAARRAVKAGVELALTTREFDLLVFFLRHPGRAFSREELMRQVWGWDFGDLSTVTVHVRRLRGKIEDDPAAPRLIQTVWGVGYRLDLDLDLDPDLDLDLDLGSGSGPQGDATRSDRAPDVPQPDRAPDVSRPDRAPDVARPDRAPDVARPDRAPDVARPDRAPDVARPDRAPDVARPDRAPDVARPDRAPDVARPDRAPDVARPDGAPDVSQPDRAPEVPGPDRAPEAPRPDRAPADWTRPRA